MNLQTRVVEEPEELEQVFRFRYRVYVEEMRRDQQYADHDRKVVCEPLDRAALNFATYYDDAIVGVARMNWGWQALGGYQELYRMDLAGPWHPRTTTITTKLMVAATHRRSGVLAHLATAVFGHAYNAGARFNFIDCTPPLDRLYAHLGYRQAIPDVRHPEYGLVRPMVLSAADREHLVAVGSPFVRLLNTLPADGEAARFGRDFLFQARRAHSAHPWVPAAHVPTDPKTQGAVLPAGPGGPR